MFYEVFPILGRFTLKKPGFAAFSLPKQRKNRVFWAMKSDCSTARILQI
jgi:hypothetical protein